MKILKIRKKVGNLCCETTKPTLMHEIGYFETKIGEIFEKSAKQVRTKWNLARKKAFFGLVFSVIELRNVHFTELAIKFNPSVEIEFTKNTNVFFRL